MSRSYGALSVVATPIGNLGDISERAKATLTAADIICCEDTRVTGKLLHLLGIAPKRLVALHQHSSADILQNIVHELAAGKNVSMVTDAGTPNISDPGGQLVALAVEAGIAVTPIPGPSACIAALSIAGVPADHFVFLGFPPQKKGRKTYFAGLAAVSMTVVLYESTHRIAKTLAELPEDRYVVVCRELTKLHETVYRGTVPQITAQLAKTSTKGEFVIVIAPKDWTV